MTQNADYARCHYVIDQFSTDTRRASRPCERPAVAGDFFCRRHVDSEQARMFHAQREAQIDSSGADHA